MNADAARDRRKAIIKEYAGHPVLAVIVEEIQYRRNNAAKQLETAGVDKFQAVQGRAQELRELESFISRCFE